MKTIDVLRLLADAADEVANNIYDANEHIDEETGERHRDYRRLRVAERLARRTLNGPKEATNAP